jgi:hypothetical protein
VHPVKVVAVFPAKLTDWTPAEVVIAMIPLAGKALVDATLIVDCGSD